MERRKKHNKRNQEKCWRIKRSEEKNKKRRENGTERDKVDIEKIKMKEHRKNVVIEGIEIKEENGRKERKR